MDVPLLPLLSPPPGQSHPSIKPRCAPEHQRFLSQDTDIPTGLRAHIPPPAPWGDPMGPLLSSSSSTWGLGHSGHQGTPPGWWGKRGAVAPVLCIGTCSYGAGPSSEGMG